MKQPKNPKKTITILGKRWFDRVNGNTYHSAMAYVDGVLVGRVNFEYGYGSQWEQTCQEILEKAKHLPGLKHHDEPLWQYCERKRFALVSNVSDVQRKRDL